jgi:polyhydroxybutyrate depolymerase
MIPMSHGGFDRPYLLQVPRGSGGSVAPALLVELHGRGIDPVRFDQLTGFGELAGEFGFALALPAAIGEIWNDGRDAGPPGRKPDDVAYLAAVIADAVARVGADPRRAYLAGMSNGAAMAGRMACDRSDLIAGIAQVAGTVGSSVAGAGRTGGPVAIIDIHGTADRMAPYEGGVRKGLLSHVIIRHAIGPSIGVDDWARYWVAANRAADPPLVTALPPDVTIRTWRGPTPSSDVVFYRVEGAGHTWPGSRITLPAFIFGRTSRTFDATRVICEFLAAHRR